MKSALEVFFETFSNSLGRPSCPRTLEEFEIELTKDRIMREGVNAVLEAMEKHAANAVAFRTQILIENLNEAKSTITQLREDLAKVQETA